MTATINTTACDILDDLLADAPPFVPTDMEVAPVENVGERETPGPSWPTLADDAYHGLAGEIVREIEPHSEGDPVAILVQFLVLAGNCIGPGPYYQIEGDRHHLNLFAVTVGVTAGGRKGVSLGRARQPLEAVDEAWATTCIEGGLSSAEGVLWRLRDEVRVWQTDKKTGTGEWVVTDPGVPDKRLTVVETEFASVLRQFQREGNTLSALLRNAWDGRTLTSMTKNSPAKATAPHLSLIGHITKDELARNFESTEAANGLGNRILWVCTRRSKLLPDGGGAPNLAPLITRLHTVIDAARKVGAMMRGEDARALWHEVYPTLVAERPGMLGAMTSRAAPIIVRLSMLYALLDHTHVIRVEHVRAALALWTYADASVRWIFGDTLGDSTADEILRALRGVGNVGLARTEISGLFNRNRNAGQIGRALASLEEAGLAQRVQAHEGGMGRPPERWLAM